jgi:hypothetical protein
VLQNGDSTAKGVLYPEHGLSGWRRLETLSRVYYKQTLRVFLTIVVHRVIVGSLVTSLKACESVTFFFNCPVFNTISNRQSFTAVIFL